MKLKVIFGIIGLLGASALQGEGELFLASPISFVQQGATNGTFELKNLEEKGDFGYGFFAHLDGEMVAYKGEFYAVNAKGGLKKVKKGKKLASARLTFFSPEYSFDLKNLRNENILYKTVLEQITQKNTPCAIMIKGSFLYLKLGSFKPQKERSMPWNERLEDQSTYHMEKVEGTAIGFWSPSYWENFSEKGPIFYFITTDGKKGGRILDAHLLKGEAFIQPLSKVEVELPEFTDLIQAGL